MMGKEINQKGISSRIKLEALLDKQQGLYQLANRLNWDYLIEAYGPYYVENNGRPGIPIRVIVGLHYLKYLEQESDESVVEKFCENPYWQYFCGLEYFVHTLPCHPTTLVKWRNRVGIDGVEKLLEHVVNTAKREGFLPEKLLVKVNIDTTVQEKNITFPTDAKLYFKACKLLVKAAKAREIPLRQSYVRVSKLALQKSQRYSHARQMKRAKKEIRRLKTYVGRLIREIKRKALVIDQQLAQLLNLVERVHAQRRGDSNKVYSLHAPEVECIAKGKTHKKYEFGCKVSIATTAKEPWIVSISAEHGNPYDGHTLKSTVARIEKITGVKPKQAFVDRGYKGNENYPPDVEIFVSGKTKGLTQGLKKLLRARSAIEPIIGHAKQDHGLSRNYLLGTMGDKINAVLVGCAFNLRKMMRLIKLKPAIYCTEFAA
jgi:IS5 family transposase